jgi:hypothetical protein
VHAKHEEERDGKTVLREYNREFLLPAGTGPPMETALPGSSAGPFTYLFLRKRYRPDSLTSKSKEMGGHGFDLFISFFDAWQRVSDLN